MRVETALELYRRDGFVHVPAAFDEADIAPVRERMRLLMEGQLDHTPFFFQQDSESGRYEDAPLGVGWVGPSPTYRKIEKLERDPVVFGFLQNPLFREITHAVIAGPAHIYRTILMTKPSQRDHARGGTDLPWHQDGGRLWGLSADPELQLWVALDDAPREAGCMRFAVGSHREGFATALGGKVPDQVVKDHLARFPILEVPARRGDLVILHNAVWHASGLNTTDHTRRALSVCLIPESTRCTRKRGAPRTFPVLFPT